MEELKSADYASVAGGTDGVIIGLAIPATRTWTVGSVVEGKRVLVKVDWLEAGNPKTEEVVTLIANLNP